MNNNTISNATPITSENIRDILDKMALHKCKIPQTPKKRKKWFERLMNKLGWYVQTEVWVLMERQFKPYTLMPKMPLEWPEFRRINWFLKYGGVIQNEKKDIKDITIS